ncbi:nitroreductase [Luteimonas yindakuii]|uniref:nitroreductase family protein n=1 Tax=Luteimonas yindakuii TaxID=2565782 RepID=UPI0010A47B1E|nr:nitroreductase [Luteimonas yindakuii]QCO68260.1 nitroreductase [Luteimonas yindakuii]
MPIPNTADGGALRFLDQRRSTPARQLDAPGPDDPTLLRILASAVRVPDHGKRVPFRFLRIAGDARQALGERVATIGQRHRPDAGPAAVDRQRFAHAPLVLAVVAVLDPDDTAIPDTERLMTAGCVCFAVLQAAQALGYGGTWLTGWPAFDPEVMAELGLGEDERIAGFIHLGTPRLDVPERERPDPATLLRDWTPA